MSFFNEESLYLAYRKAKADLFFERSIPNARKFAQYEDELEGNLGRLLRRLAGVSGKKWFNDKDFIGGVSFVPKSLTLPEESEDEPKSFASSALDNWERIFRCVDEQTFVNQEQSIALPHQNLAAVEYSVEKHKIVSLHDILLEVAFDNATQRVETLAHVGRQGMNEDA